jgi:hypothetical protein
LLYSYYVIIVFYSFAFALRAVATNKGRAKILFECSIKEKASYTITSVVMEASSQQDTTFFLSEKSFVEYKKFAFYFNSHIDNVKPIVLNKTAAQKFLSSFGQLEKLIANEKLGIQQDLNVNATLLEMGQTPYAPVDKEFYQQTLTEFKVWQIRLTANKYQNTIYVWLKLYVQNSEDPTIYLPCKGGVILPWENFDALKNFMITCLKK